MPMRNEIAFFWAIYAAPIVVSILRIVGQASVERNALWWILPIETMPVLCLSAIGRRLHDPDLISPSCDKVDK